MIFHRILTVSVLCFLHLMLAPDMGASFVAGKINLAPGEKYIFEERLFQGIPSIETTSEDHLWVSWYSGGNAPGSEDNYVVLARSIDGGITWIDPVAVVDPPGEVRAFDPCLWRDPRGRLWWFWAESAGFFDGKAGVWYMRCDHPNDQNPNWSEPKRIADGVMLNKPLVSSTGDWLFPIALWARTGGSSELHRSNVYVSPDQGESFAYRGGANYPGRSFDEHMLLEKHDGTLVLFTRLQAGGIGQSLSHDRGISWTNVGIMSIQHPDVRFFIKKLSSGNWLLVHQPSATSRVGLMARISADEGRTWTAGLMLDKRSGVSYPDGIEDENGLIRVIYDYDRSIRKDILIASFKEEDALLNDSNALVTTKVVSGLSVSGQQFDAEKANLLIEKSQLAQIKVINTPGEEYQDSKRPFQGIPALAQTSKNRMWASWYAGGRDEGEENYVLLVRSDDSGKTWSTPLMVIDIPGPLRAFDPCLWVDPLGRLWWFWAQSVGWFDGIAGTWYVRCDNPNARELQWTKPRRIANGIMMNKPSVLLTGEWALPIALWARFGGNSEMHRSNVYVSSDKGSTFKHAGGADYPGRAFDEHMVLDRKNGEWVLFTRLLSGGIGQSVSKNRGATWENVGTLPVKHPDSRFSINRLKSGGWLMIHHDSMTERHLLMARLSRDEGRTWTGSLLIDPRQGVSYPDVVEHDGLISVIYDYSRYLHREIWMSQFRERDVTKPQRANINTARRILINRPPPFEPTKQPK